MARTVNEIKRTMTDSFMANETVRSEYGLAEGATWEGSFSNVSIENILFFIVSASIYLLEVIFDAFKSDVNETVRTAVVASVPWYHRMALEYQDGDELAFDEVTQSYKYETEHPAQRIVKFASVRDMGTSVQMLVSKSVDGMPAVLTNDELTRFKKYMQRVKVAGVILGIKSLPSDSIKINVKVYVDGLLYNKSGTLVKDGTEPVKNAIENYLRNIIYGGTFNKTKLVDAIQAAEGVKDVELGECVVAGEIIRGNNYESSGGSFVLDNESEIEYEL